MSVQTTGVLGANIAVTTTTQDFPLGTKIAQTDNQEYVYVQADGAITQYYAVGIDENFQAGHLTTTMAGDGWFVGLAQVAFADNDYGWVCIAGSNVNGVVEASCKVDSPLYAGATAGVLREDSTGGTKLDGIINVVSGGTEATTVEMIMTWPRSSTL